MEGPQRFLSVILVATFLFMLLILIVSKNEPSSLPQLKIYHNNHTQSILFWTGFFGDRYWKHVSLGDHCEVQCKFSFDNANPLLHDAIIFHGRNHHSPPKERSAQQVYIMLLQESPYHRGGFVKGDHFYNWSVTYARKSDVLMPYFAITKITNQSEAVNITVKSLPQLSHNRTKEEAMIAWVVSNCGTPGKRKMYVEKLKTYMKVDIFGGCGKPCPGKKCHEALAKTGHYKFYLSFENSVCKDYITEKAWFPLREGLLPIVYGGMAPDDYKARLPPESYIDVRDFKSPKQLSEYLEYLDGNTTAYLEYFTWRKTHKLGGSNAWCDLCRALYNNSMAVRRNINWDKFWNAKTDCDGNFLQKVLGQNRR